jgi:hypothetical protein
MIKKLEREFGPDVADMREALPPMGPGNAVERPSEDDPQLTTEEQKRYRSGVGMLLYLVKLSRSDLSNAVRELSKVMDGATVEHVNLMLRVVKFILGTKERGVLVKPDLNRNEILAFADSDFAGDKGSRRSITGF